MGADNYHWELIGRGQEEANKPADCGCSRHYRPCPLHAAAGQMAEALEAILEDHKERLRVGVDLEVQVARMRVMAEGRAALAAAGRGK